MNWETVTEQLKAPLDPQAIKPPPQGKFGDYVDALHVLREANRIFGYDGWSYDVKSLQLTNSDGGKIGYLAIVAVTVDGVTRTDVGHGQGHNKSLGDAHDSAVKEAVTDALKRALRTFGNTFGLALYEKDKSKREVGTPPVPHTETRDRIKSALTRQVDAAALDGVWKHRATVEAVAGLPEPMQGELQKAYTDRMGEVFQAPKDMAAE